MISISVIIPVYNGLSFIQDAIESVFAQTLPVNEIICVDDASQDGTFEFITTNFPTVKLLRNSENKGPSFCRNWGVQEANGIYIAFLDADDLWVKEKIEWQFEQFKKDSAIEITGGLCEHFQLAVHENSTYIETIKEPHFNSYLGTLLIKKTVFDEVGYFDITLRLSEDQDWFLRLRESNISVKIIDKSVLKIRIHDNNTTKNLSFKQIGIMKAIKMSLDRRRETGNINNLKSIV